MTAAFVPTFTRTLQQRGREHAWRLGNLVINALLRHHRDAVASRDLLRRPDHGALRPGVRGGAGQAGADDALTRIMLPFLTTVAVAVAMMGMLNSLRRFFIPSLSPAMFNVATILCAVALVPLMHVLGLAADHRDRHWHAARRPRPDRDPVAGAAQGRLPLPPDPRLPRSRAARDPAPDGPRHARPCRGSDQRLRQYLPRRGGAGRRVLARLRVPAHVPADRHLRRLDRDGVAARHLAARRTRGHAGDRGDRSRARCG